MFANEIAERPFQVKNSPILPWLAESGGVCTRAAMNPGRVGTRKEGGLVNWAGIHRAYLTECIYCLVQF